MSELSPEAKRLLQSARESFSPDQARVDAVRDSLAAKIAALGSGGAESSAGTTLSASGAAPALRGAAFGSGGAVAPKLLAIGLIAAAGAGALWFGTRDVERAPTPASTSASAPAFAPDPAAARPIAPPQPSAQTDGEPTVTKPASARSAAVRGATERSAVTEPIARRPVVERAAVESRDDIARATRHPPARARSGAAAPNPASQRGAVRTATPAQERAPAPAAAALGVEAEQEPADDPRAPEEDPDAALAPAPGSDSLAGELALLRRARSALDRRDADAALALAKQHAARYPRGTLRQERLATQVLALCGLQRTEEARVLARELERVAPRSPHLMRIRASCVTEEGSDEVR
jgi:hypothetical protein